MLWPAISSIGQDLLPTKAGTPASAASANLAAPSPTPTAIPESALTLIPPPLPSPKSEGAVTPAGPDMPDLSQLDQLFKQSTPGKEAEAYRAHVEWRELKNRTVNDPAVVAAKTTAEAATTDLEKRNRLRRYYEIFYARMQALASTPQMATYLIAMKKVHLSLLDQPRVRPTPEPKKKVERQGENNLPNE
jgi:hypothetical protein